MFCVSVCLVPERERKRDIKGEGGVETGKEEEREKVVVNNPTVSWKKKKTIPQSPTTCNCKLPHLLVFPPSWSSPWFPPKDCSDHTYSQTDWVCCLLQQGEHSPRGTVEEAHCEGVRDDLS